MNMQIIIAITCLGLLLWVDPANAQDTKTYPDTKTFDVTVGRHKAVTLSKEKADDILAEASKVLKNATWCSNGRKWLEPSPHPIRTRE
jgi:hypothetical protein